MTSLYGQGHTTGYRSVQKWDYAIVSKDPIAAVVETQKYRSQGLSCVTYFVGNRKRQLARARQDAFNIIDLDAEAGQ